MQTQGHSELPAATVATALQAEGFVRLSTVLSVVPVGRTRWYQGVRTGEFPAPVKIGEKVSAWRVSDIRKLIAKIESGGANARAA